MSFLSSLAVALLATQCNFFGVSATPFGSQQARGADPAVIGGYAYQGCYTEPTTGRALRAVTSAATMTLEKCAAICSASVNTGYFGVEYGKECWCGNVLAAGTKQTAEAACKTPCTGNANQLCGAGRTLNLYKNGAVGASSTSTSHSTTSSSKKSSSTSTTSSVPAKTTAVVVAVACSPDNCLNQVKNNLASAAAFCATYTTAVNANPSAIPSFLKHCVSNPSRVSSACTCIATRGATSRSTTSSVPSTTSQSSSTTSNSASSSNVPVGLSNAALTNAQDVVVNGEVMVLLTPPSGGQASLQTTVNSPNIDAGSFVVIQANVGTTQLVSPAKRDTACNLTISLGGTIIYNGPVSSNGNFPAIRTTPTVYRQPMILIITETCFSTVTPATVGNVVIIPTSQTSSSQPPTSVPSTASSTTSSATPTEPTRGSVTTTPGPTVPIYSSPPLTSGACAVGSIAASCTISGAPVATSGLLAVATGIPASTGGNYPPAYEQCARVCASVPYCASWNLDRNLAADGTYTCNIYSGVAHTYAPSYSYLYDRIVWFDSDCYSCTPENLSIGGGSQSSGPNQSIGLTSSPSSSGSSSTSSASSTITAAPSITPAPVVSNIHLVPYTASTCSMPGGYYSCILSGVPVATSGLLAKATAVPIPSGGNNNPAYEQCAGLCYNFQGCNAWALDRGVGVYPNAQLPSWTCWLYSGNINTYAVSYNSVYMAVVYFGRGCYNCNPQELAYDAPAVPSTSSTSLSPSTPQTTATTSASSSSSQPTSTSTSAPMTTAGPTVSASQAPAYVSGACSQGEYMSCTLSGAPIVTSGLLAMATGVPATYSAPRDEAQYQQCALGCAETTGCLTFALDRSSGYDSSALWTCYFYSGTVDTYVTDDLLQYDPIVYFASDCYICTIPVASSSSGTASFSSTLTSNNIVTTSAQPTSTSLSTSTSSQSGSISKSSTSSSPTSTTMPTTAAPPTIGSVPTFSAPAVSTTCSYPTGAWYANGCTQSGYPTATSGLVAVATGIVALAPGNYNFEPYYQRCAIACAGVSGCTGFALDRGGWPTDMSTWTCYLYGMDINAYLAPLQTSNEQRKVVWMNELCYACPASGPFGVAVSSSSSESPSTSASSSSTTTSSTSSSTSTAPSSTATCTPLPAPAISVTGPACSIQGFSKPANPISTTSVSTRAACAAYCSHLNNSTPETCGSFMFSAPTSFCGVWSQDAWTTIGSNAVAGSGFRENVMDDAGCWGCL